MECDGVSLALPPDIEGLLVLNINSYMGGVDLWASGSAWHAGQPGHHATPSKQSICDGKLEVTSSSVSSLLVPLEDMLLRLSPLPQSCCLPIFVA